MGMTQRELLGALGAECLLGERRDWFVEIEDGQGVRVTGEVFRSTPDAPVMARITHQDAARPAPHKVCEFRADPQGGRYAVTGFTIGRNVLMQDGQWVLFKEADACAFVRVVMTEIEARRMPDFDELLSMGSTGIAVEWERIPSPSP